MVSASSTLLLSIPRASVSYVHSGNEQAVGEFPVSLSVVNIPVTSSPKAKETEELDQWLLLALTKGEQNVFELPLAGTTRVISVPSPAGECYLIPLLYGDLERFLPLGEMSGMEVGADSEREGGYLRLTLDGTDQRRMMEEKEMLESILWGMTCSTFESQAPVASASVAGKGKATDSKVDSLRNKLVLVDEESGKVIGEVETPIPNLDDATSPLEEKSPVLIDLTTAQPTIRTLSSILSSSSESFKPTENPSGSTIITIGDLIGRGAIIGSEIVGWSLQKGAQAVVDNTKKTDKPLVFGEQTRKNIDASNKLTGGALKVSAATVGYIGEAASRLGGVVGSSLGIQASSDGKPPRGIRGVLNKSLIAFNTITDSIETGGKNLIQSSTLSTGVIVGHKFGPDAAHLSHQVGSSFKHVALVYIDARGVTRKALLKTVGSTAIKAKMRDGTEMTLQQNAQAELVATAEKKAEKGSKLD